MGNVKIIRDHYVRVFSKDVLTVAPEVIKLMKSY